MPESFIKRTNSGHTKNLFRHDALTQKIGETPLHQVNMEAMQLADLQWPVAR